MTTNNSLNYSTAPIGFNLRGNGLGVTPTFKNFSISPIFLVLTSSVLTSATGDGTVVKIPLNNAIFNIGTTFDTTTYTFTTPSTGNYFFIFEVYSGLSSINSCNITLVTSPISKQYDKSGNPNGSGEEAVEYVAASHLSSGDTVFLNYSCSGTAKNVTIFGARLSGYLIGT